MVLDSSKDYFDGSILMSCEDDTSKEEVVDYLMCNHGVESVQDCELVERDSDVYMGYKNTKMFHYRQNKRQKKEL